MEICKEPLSAGRTPPPQRTLYMRPLPQTLHALDSEAGQRIFAEALFDGSMASYFKLAQQFHTQSDPAYCGLGSLVCALNALGIDPARPWKGPWRWFSEELPDCCKPLDVIRSLGLSLDEVACLGVSRDVEWPRFVAAESGASVFQGNGAGNRQHLGDGRPDRRPRTPRRYGWWARAFIGCGDGPGNVGQMGMPVSSLSRVGIAGPGLGRGYIVVWRNGRDFSGPK